MRKEYDLANELGRKNWLDGVAGEAYLLGSCLGDPQLSLRGTQLALMIKVVPYDSDEFSRVIAEGVDLLNKVEEAKSKAETVIFIDELPGPEEKRKDFEWWYSLLLVEGGYQIKMVLPEYYGKSPDDGRAERVVDLALDSYGNREHFEVKEKIELMGSQKMEITEVRNDKREILRKIDFNHECGYKRGQILILFFTDYHQAAEVWEAVRTTSGRKTSG